MTEKMTVEAIRKKVAEHGYDSLTEEDRDFAAIEGAKMMTASMSKTLNKLFGRA